MKLRVLAGSLLVLAIALNLLWVAMNVGDLRDYGSFIAAGKAASRGDNPYAVYEDTYVAHLDGDEIDLPNLNPPISLYAFEGLSKVDPGLGKGTIVALSAGLYAAVIVMLLRRYPEKRTPLVLIWAVSLAGFWHTLELGQVYIPLLAAITGAWLLQDHRPLLAGVLLGVAIAIKPNFALLPLLLFIAGEQRISLSSLGTAAGLSAVPLLLDGPSVYRQWLEASRAFAGLEMPGNSSLLAISARAGVSELGYAASALLVIAMAAFAYRVRRSTERLFAAGLVGALLLGPISWSGYTLFVLPVLIARPRQRWELAAAALLAVPVPFVLGIMPLNVLSEVLIGPLYGWGLLILLGLLVRDAWLRRRPAVDYVTVRPVDEPEALAA
jgi:hypothetical protein